MRCRDCGKSPFAPSDSRADICVDCLALRGRLLTAVTEKRVALDDFRDVQSLMCRGCGEAAYRSRILLGEVPL
jgi:hypothetical protein